jgi:hypothetical protein
MVLTKAVKGLSKLRTLSLGTVILIIQLFIFTNTKLFFPTETDQFQHIILVYLLLQSTLFAIPDLRMRLFNTPFLQALPKLALSFAVTIFILGLVGSFIKGFSIISNIANIPFGILIMHVTIIAIVEENMFRLILPQRVGIIISSILFSLFHYVVYQGSWLQLTIAFVMSFVLYWIQLRFSPRDGLVNSGVHAGYNAFVLGLV